MQQMLKSLGLTDAKVREGMGKATWNPMASPSMHGSFLPLIDTIWLIDTDYNVIHIYHIRQLTGPCWVLFLMRGTLC